jgi:hypothetical protein
MYYLTEIGFKIFKRQYDLYLKSKVAPDTCNATGLWLSLEPESKIVPLVYSHGDYSDSERITHFYGYPLQVIYKANKKKWQMQSLNTFLQEVQKTVISNN